MYYLELLSLLKHLEKITAFRGGTNEKIYKENNGIFLSLIEIIAEFDPTMKEHIRWIKDNQINSHYLGHRIQNELINLLANEIKTKIIKKLRKQNIFLSYLIVLLI